LANNIVKQPLAALAVDPDRFEKLSHRVGPLLVDFSRQRIDHAVRAALVELGEDVALKEGLTRLMAGAHVNASEDRPALHTALRAPAEKQPDALRKDIAASAAQMARFVERVRAGSWRGHTGKPVRDIVHIGIGGSHLGPEMVTNALPATGPRLRFLANIDGHAFARALDGLNAETTLFIVASKSFTTLETHVNAQSARAWCVERGCPQADLGQHFVAVTANTSAATAFGIAAENLFPMWDWVGGRYSLWSAVGLPVALSAGMRAFDDLLAGAFEVDQHALSAPLERNLPALMALVGIWNFNFLGAQTHAVLPYDHRLAMLPAYLQQLEMESNGKSVQHDGQPTSIQTAGILWGGEETNGQHAFHQLLLQGTRAFSADLIAATRPNHSLADHHRWLLANCLAQGEALARGSGVDHQGANTDPLAAHRAVEGNHATTTILLEELTPRSLGALIALYEHKVYCQSIIWNINAFDQWGVELGKQLGGRVHSALSGSGADGQDPSTRSLVDEIRRSH
jgi:glucose-6-phosphate isomerase